VLSPAIEVPSQGTVIAASWRLPASRRSLLVMVHPGAAFRGFGYAFSLASPPTRRLAWCSAGRCKRSHRPPRHPDDIVHLLLAGTLADFNPARVDALLLHQVRLSVDRALSSQIHRMTILASSTIGALSPSA